MCSRMTIEAANRPRSLRFINDVAPLGVSICSTLCGIRWNLAKNLSDFSVLVRMLLKNNCDQDSITDLAAVLDGGGVRGLSSLMILDELEQAFKAKLDQDGVHIRVSVNELKPCRYFDMIAGTSTGGCEDQLAEI